MLSNQQKSQIKDLINECKLISEGINDYGDNSNKYPRARFQSLFYKAQSLYEEIKNKKENYNAAMRWWTFDGDWFFEAKYYVDELKKLLKNEKEISMNNDKA